MKKPADDSLLDLDLSNITGDIKQKVDSTKKSPTPLVLDPLGDALKTINKTVIPKTTNPETKKPVSYKTETPQSLEETEWKECVDRLKNHCNKTFICLPKTTNSYEGTTTTYYSSSLDQVSDEDFFTWLDYSWPGIKGTMKPSDFSKISAKEKAFNGIVYLHKALKFPKVDIFNNQALGITPKSKKGSKDDGDTGNH